MHHLYRHLAACDLAVVQGGLTTKIAYRPVETDGAARAAARIAELS